jgi:hypothetical protein
MSNSKLSAVEIITMCVAGFAMVFAIIGAIISTIRAM